MKIPYTYLALFILFAFTRCASAQQSLEFAPLSAAERVDQHETEISVMDNLSGESEDQNEKSEKKKDPGYDLYKIGYQFILNEEWEKARTSLFEMTKKFPKSEYVDDAEYWLAYALGHLDKEKAISAYEHFIESYPKSNYYDDAVADLNGLGSSYTIVSSGDGVPAIARGNAHSYTYSTAPTARLADQQMQATVRKMNVNLRRLRPPKVYSGISSGSAAAWSGMTLSSTRTPRPDDHIDRETQLKMDALNAIGNTREDSISFRTLRDVAIDVTQPRVLRETAMDVLSDFHQIDVLPVFVEIAKKDTSEEIQNSAIAYMGQLSHNKNKSVEILGDLFYAIPKHRSTQQQTVLASIAEIGNDKAVDFLTKVARSNDDYELRSDAVYYLGNIGGDKARAALYDILKGK